MVTRRALGLLLGVCMLLPSLGCTSKYVLDLNERLLTPEMVSKKQPDETYVVEQPDRIQIEFFNEYAPPPRSVGLRPDGCVTLPYLEDVEVEGLTTLEIREKLEDLYSKYYKEPRILVTVVSYNSKHIYVYGEVGRAGQVPYTGSQTVREVMGAIGGFTRRAAPTRVKVIRGDPEYPYVFKVNLKRLIYRGELYQDVNLAPGDTIYVPPNAFAWLGYQIDNLLFPFRSVLAAASTAESVQGLQDFGKE